MSNNEKIIKIFTYLKIIRDMNNEVRSSNAFKTIIENIEKTNREILSGSDAQTFISGVGKKSKYYIDSILKNKNKNITGVNEIDRLSDDERNKIFIIYEMIKIPGVGLKTALKYYEEGYDIDELKEYLNSGHGTTRQRIGVKYVDELKRRIPRNKIDIFNDTFRNLIRIYNNRNNTELKYHILGSYCRGAETSGDLDIILYSFYEDDVNESFLEFLKTNRILKETLSSGYDSYQGIAYIDEDFQSVRIDIKLIHNMDEYYYALLYFTGPAKFNERMRDRAERMEYKLGNNEMIDLRTNKRVIVDSEEEIFDILDMEYLDPENRN